MNGRFRNTLVLGLALTMSPAAFARTRTTPRGEAELEITLRVYNYAQVPASELAGAESGAASILREAGIETRWLDCPLSKAELKMNPVCNHTAGPAKLWLKVLPESMFHRFGFSKTTMGFALLSPDGRRGSESFISYRWVDRLAEMEYAPRHAILAHAMAHEIGHLLLGTNSHFPVGIMRADWSQEDQKRASRGGLHFTPQQADRMRQAVQARIELETLAAKLGASTLRELAAIP